MKYILFFLLGMNTLQAFSQNFLIPYRKGDKYGFADTTGKVLVEPNYDFVQSYKHYGNENIVYTFNISNKNKPITDLKKEEVYIGLIDSRNLKEIIAPKDYNDHKYANSQYVQYDYGWMQTFVESSDLYYKEYFKYQIGNIILGKKNTEREEMYFADSTGKLLIPAPFKNITIFSEIKGKQYYRLIDFNNKHRIVDNLGSNPMKSSFDAIKCVDYLNGTYKIIAEKNKKYGLIDMSGKVILPFVYEEINKLSRATNLDENKVYTDAKTIFYTLKKGTKWIYLNRDLKPIKQNEMDDEAIKATMQEQAGEMKGIDAPTDDENKVFTKIEICNGVNRKNYKYEILKNCKEIVPYEYDYIETKYTTGRKEFFYYVEKNRIFGLLDSDGNEIVPMQLKQYGTYNPEMNTYTDYDILTDTLGKKGLYHFPTRKFIFPIRYESISHFETKDGLLVNIVHKNKSTLYDSNFKSHRKYKYKISPLDSYNKKNALDSLIFFKEKDGLLGLIYGDEKEIIPQNYKSIYFHNNIFLVKNKNDKYGLRNSRNDLLLEEKYDSITFNTVYWVEKNPEMIFVKYNGRFGVLNDALKEVIPIEYDSWPKYSNDYRENESNINFFTLKKDSILYLGNHENPRLVQFYKNDVFEGGINNLSSPNELNRKYFLRFSNKDKMESKKGLIIFTKDKVLFQSNAKYKQISFERDRITYKGINFPIFYLEWENKLRYAVDLVSPSGVKFFED
jgi:hypothetical protein